MNWSDLAVDYLKVAAIACPLLVAILMRRHWKRKKPSGICKKCDYNLTGNVSGFCPECGTKISN